MKFSDFRRFVDKHADNLQDKRILMYCTGLAFLLANYLFF